MDSSLKHAAVRINCLSCYCINNNTLLFNQNLYSLVRDNYRRQDIFFALDFALTFF